MMFLISALLLTLTTVNGEAGFTVDSKAGRKLLRKALERPENVRMLENAEMDGQCQNILEFLQQYGLTVNQFMNLYESGQIVNYNGGNNFAGMDYDQIKNCESQIAFSVMGNMFIKYVGCASFVQDEADYANYWCRENDNQQAQQEQQDAQGEGNQYQWNQNANGNNAQAQAQCNQNANEEYWMQKYGYQQAQNGNWNQNAGAQNEWEAEWWEYQVKAMNDGLEATNLVHFTLCSDSYCGSCNGDYVMEMVDFLELYTEYKMEHAEYWCEKIRENCQCGYGSDWVTCYNTCFETKGLTYGDCKGYMDQNAAANGNMFDIQQYLECAGVQFYNPEYIFSNDAGSYSYQHFYYIGPTCKDGAVVLGGFHDLQCTYSVDSADMQNLIGSYSIPYLEGSGQTLLKPDLCISCLDPDDEADAYEQGQDYNWQDNQNWDDQPEPSEICAMVTGYDGEGKSMVCDQQNNDDCNYILYTLPIYEQKGESSGQGFFGGNSVVANLAKQVTRSKRISYALIGVVAALVFALAYFIGTLNRRIEPKNRKALLEYRREGGELS